MVWSPRAEDLPVAPDSLHSDTFLLSALVPDFTEGQVRAVLGELWRRLRPRLTEHQLAGLAVRNGNITSLLDSGALGDAREATARLVAELLDPDHELGRRTRKQHAAFAGKRKLQEPPAEERLAVKEILRLYRQKPPKRPSLAQIATHLNRKTAPELNRRDGRPWNKDTVACRWKRWKGWHAQR